ncbi:hypothetical protein HF078_11050 [Bacillus sp. RO2]|uniref:hypothetical protein n=1 Tax=Bacillus sp. RO2 TaxID=2723913 RepID=UPI00145D1CD2|nr:hypothetical protein [Bacillus sp. RO2]NMH73615.1 hypothetical protein [Bacillus sp. RO2]
MKKTRGWKRRVRQLDKLIETHSSFDIQQLTEYKVDNLKLFSYHDIHLVPAWYKKKVVSSMLELYKVWKEQAAAELDEFYIRLHIHSQNIFNSEIILAIDDKMEVYKERFHNEKKEPSLPPWLNSKDDWKTFHLHSTWLEDELDTLSDQEKNALLQRLVETKKAPDYNGNMIKIYVINEEIVYFLESVWG